MKPKHKLGTKAIIAATFYVHMKAIREHERRETGVYLLGDDYYTCGHKPPQLDGRDWKKYEHQFFAHENGTVLWVATDLDGS